MSTNTGIYDTFAKELLYTKLDENIRLDQAILEAHLMRLGNGAILLRDHGTAIWQGKTEKLDPNDYDRKVRVEDDRIFVPAPFVNRYFGENLKGDADLTALCTERNIPLFYDTDTGLIAVTPPSVTPVKKETDARFIQRMLRVLQEPYLPEPQYNNSEQTRKVIAVSHFPEDGRHWKEKVYDNLYSPTLLVTKNANGDKRIYVAHELNKASGHGEAASVTVLLCSDDGGETFREIDRVDDLRWAHLFEAGGSIHLLGSRVTTKLLAVARLEENGRFKIAEFEDLTGECCPNAGLTFKGRIYIPNNPQILSADENTDLLDTANWTVSNSAEEVLTREWYFKVSGNPKGKYYRPLEPNIIATPEGEIYTLWRLEMQPYNGRAAILRLSADGATLSHVKEVNSLVKLPTTVSKFCVRYDVATKLYLTLPSHPTLPTPMGPDWPPFAGQRNILSIAASPDLIHWKTLDILLTEHAVINPAYSAICHGHQYAVWDFDGDDILYIVREATDYTRYYHDGKYVSLYRLKNYKQFIAERYTAADFYGG